MASPALPDEAPLRVPATGGKFGASVWGAVSPYARLVGLVGHGGAVLGSSRSCVVYSSVFIAFS